MLRLHYLLIGILLLFIAETARAQQEFIVKNLGLSDGLPLNAVNDIAQDSSGYIYFATNEGLVRYDGYHMVTFNTASVPILISNRISRLVYDKSHMLWLSHYSGEITSFDGRQFTTYGTSTGLGFVYHSFEDHQGNFWVVSDIGLFEYQRSDKKFKQHPMPADSDEMTVFARDYENGLIGFSADGTLWSFKSNSFERLTESVIPDLYYSTARIYSFDSTYIWFATSNGFYAINRQNGDIAWSLTDESITKSVFPLADGRYVLASGYSFYYVDPRSFSIIQEPFRASHLLSPRILQELEDGTIIRIGENQILYGSTPIKNINKPSGFFLDRNRTLWVASQTDGVYMISQSRIQNLHELDGKPLVNVYSMYECTQEPGVFRFASYDSGIFEFGPDQNRILNSESSNLPEGILQYIYQDKDRNHYAGYLRNGLWRQITPEYWQRTSEIDQLFDDIAFSVFGMYEHPANDQFFIGTNLGLAVRTGGEWREVKGLTQESLRSIRSFSQVGDFVLLGSATSGMYILQADLQITQQITDKHGLSSNSIRDIFVQSPDTVWIVTENAGLNRMTFRDDGTFQISGINHLNGLPHNSVHRMIADTAGKMWISSNRGIFSTSLHYLNDAADNPGSILSFLTLDESSGMLNREANGGVSNSGMLTSDGRLMFPNQLGVTIIQPDDVYESRNFELPRPIIEKVTSFSDSWLPEKKGLFVLPRGVRTITIHFSAPNFQSQQQVNVSFKLNTVDATWQLSPDARSARYTELRPGTHEFLVKTEQYDGLIHITKANLVIPYYITETWLFRVLVVAALAGLALVFIRYRDKKRSELTQIQLLVDEQTNKIRQNSEEKSRLFYGLAYDLRHLLSLILGPLDVIRDLTQNEPDELQKVFEIAQRNSERMLQLTEQMMEVARLSKQSEPMKLEPANLMEETRRVVQLYQTGLNEASFDITIHMPEVLPYSNIDRVAWERIVTNLIINSQAQGYSKKGMAIYFLQQGKTLDVVFRDYGKGVPVNNPNQVFSFMAKGGDSSGSGLGLYVVKELVHRLNGDIRAEHIPAGGARFIITLDVAENPKHAIPLVQDVTDIIYLNLKNPNLNPDSIAHKLHMSRSGFYREWKKTGSTTIKSFINDIRLQESALLLKQEEYSISDVSNNVGFRDSGYFAALFKKKYGKTPGEYRNQILEDS